MIMYGHVLATVLVLCLGLLSWSCGLVLCLGPFSWSYVLVLLLGPVSLDLYLGPVPWSL